jgi:hypothetical protein
MTRALLFLLAIFTVPAAVFANQDIPPGNAGPPYFYPADPAQRLYKMPWRAGKGFNTGDGYYSEPGASHHPDYAVDFNLPDGEPILAVRAGKVNKIRNADRVCNISTSIGNIVGVTHVDSIPDSTSTRPSGWRLILTEDSYLHVRNDIPVVIGQEIHQGQIVAYTSCTGQDGGSPHLHFEVNVIGSNPVWCGTFPNRPDYCFTSIPVAFVEIRGHPNGLPEQGDYTTSQNTLYTSIENMPDAALLAGDIEAGPNPFTSRTRLRFRLADTRAASFAVYNSQGRLIRELGKGVFDKKKVYAYSWDASETPAGVYICRLTLGDRKLTRRLLHIK